MTTETFTITDRKITRAAYLTTKVACWSGRGITTEYLWLEPDGTIRVDQGGWSHDWTTVHAISETDQERIWVAAELAARKRDQSGGELGFVRLA